MRMSLAKLLMNKKQLSRPLWSFSSGDELLTKFKIQFRFFLAAYAGVLLLGPAWVSVRGPTLWNLDNLNSFFSSPKHSVATRVFTNELASALAFVGLSAGSLMGSVAFL